MDSDSICAWLTENKISFERFRHAAVNTCEEAEQLLPPIAGVGTKNLFLRDEKGRRHFLVVTTTKKSVPLKELGIRLETKLSFASPERLMRYLGVRPGSVTLLGVIHDRDNEVEIFIDEEIWNAPAIHVHPLVNTETLLLEQGGVREFFRQLDRQPQIIEL